MRKAAKIGFEASKRSAAEGKEGDIVHSEYLLLTNVGNQGSAIFSSQEDYDRFEAYLYLLNAVESLRASNFFLHGREREIFQASRGENLIAIGAYSFTPKGFSILATSRVPGGIAKFMQKLQTAYTMYFNVKYHRSGRLFHSAYRFQRAHDEAQLKYFLAQVHLDPAILFDQFWYEAHDIEFRRLAHKAAKYRYSSIGEYAEKKFIITQPQHFPEYFLTAKDPDVLTKFWKRYKKDVSKSAGKDGGRT